MRKGFVVEAACPTLFSYAAIRDDRSACGRESKKKRISLNVKNTGHVCNRRRSLLSHRRRINGVASGAWGWGTIRGNYILTTLLTTYRSHATRIRILAL